MAATAARPRKVLPGSRSDRLAYGVLFLGSVNAVAALVQLARGTWGGAAYDVAPAHAGARELLTEFTPQQKAMGIVYAMGVLYTLLALAIVCEHYFVSSLEALAKRFGLSEDVAGATLMAAGSSLPEVFSSLLALANPDTDNTLGMDAIVGSSVYNTLIIVGASAIAGGDLYLDWKPLYRDISFYYLTLFYMFFVFRTGTITVVSGLVGLFMYAIYVFLMSKNQQIFALMDRFAERYVPYLHNVTLDIQRRKGVSAMDGEAMLQFQRLEEEDPHGEHHGGGGGGGGGRSAFEVEKAATEAHAAGAGEGHGNGEIDTAFPAQGSTLAKAAWVLKAPLTMAFKYTVPNCKTERWNNWYGVWGAFTLSIVWIGILAWYLVEWASHVGCVAGIPEDIIGFTVLAAGTSLPDTISSVVVARQGSGDMAVANAIGSNVFNVLFGLGFPWTTFTLIRGPIDVSDATDGLVGNVITLACVGVFYSIVFTARRFRLNTPLGYAFCAIYSLYVIMIIVRYGFLVTPPPSNCV